MQLDFGDAPLVLITGASSGLGAACALKLNGMGIRVIGMARSMEKLQGVQKECAHPDLFFCESFDLMGSAEELGEKVRCFKGSYGPISGYLHAAGALNPQPLMLIDQESIQNDFWLNVFSALFMTQQLSKKGSFQPNFSIVFISSIAAKIGNPGAITYGMTKAALCNAVKSLSQELSTKRIRVNSILPGGFDSPMAQLYNEQLTYDYLDKVKNKTMFKELPDIGHIAEVVCFLLSKNSYWVQGQNIVVDGGETLSI